MIDVLVYNTFHLKKYEMGFLLNRIGVPLYQNPISHLGRAHNYYIRLKKFQKGFYLILREYVLDNICRLD